MDNNNYTIISCKRCEKRMEIPIEDFVEVRDGNALVCGECLPRECLPYIAPEKYERLQKATY